MTINKSNGDIGATRDREACTTSTTLFVSIPTVFESSIRSEIKFNQESHYD